jgi:hypothetical protein
VAVLSCGFWRRQFGGDRSALGRTIRLGARDYYIVGIAPRDFTGVDLRPSGVWVPFSAAASESGGDQWYLPRRWAGPTTLVRTRRALPPSVVEAHAFALGALAVPSTAAKTGGSGGALRLRECHATRR